MLLVGALYAVDMKLLNSFVYAWQGLRHCFKTQLNFRIHLLIFLLTAGMGIFFSLPLFEWLIIGSCAMLVFSLELVNTALESLCDIITREYHPQVKIVKDAAAGAVLVAAAGSFIAGVLIFLPKVLHWIAR